MYLKSKISLSYYITFLGIIPCIIIFSVLTYYGYIDVGLAMIIYIFSLPFLFVPFVFEYYIFDGEILMVKNILGITTKKIALSDYKDVYFLDKYYGRRGIFSSMSFCIVDKRKRIITLKKHYCPNLFQFTIVLSKKKTNREDMAHLHAKKNNLRVDLGYLIIIGLLSSILGYFFLIQVFETKNIEWFSCFFLTALNGLFIYLFVIFLQDFREYVEIKNAIKLKNNNVR